MKTLTAYKEHLQQLGKLESALSLLHWDQRTYLPAKGHDARAEVIGHMSKIAFTLLVSEELGEYLTELESADNLSNQDRASVRIVGKRYRRQKSIPPDLYEEYSIARSKSESAWEQARSESDFDMFLPHLEKMVNYSRQFAEYYGYEESPYDALIEEYEPGMTSSKLHDVIDSLREALVPLIRQLDQNRGHPEDKSFSGSFPISKQRKLSTEALKSIGYDFDAGRIDTTAHPFTIATGPGDVRVTTRFHEDDPFSGLFSSLHEGGHALYDQGFAAGLRWTGLDQGTSYGIHESQSRTWENLIGRSLPFWTYFLPVLIDIFPSLQGTQPKSVYRAVNIVKPSLIRVEADEATYNLHIMLRFELEQALICGDIEAKDLPGLWNNAMKRYLGVVPKDDAEGVLQDVHWSAGLFGYFPSYMLGNLYAAQLWATLKNEIPDCDQCIASGDLSTILSWMQDNIHRHGATYEPTELITRVTGESLNPKYFTDYITAKYTDICNM